jgi:limonene-1,2-epoxide hydrolase
MPPGHPSAMARMTAAVAVVRAWREALNARALARMFTLVDDRLEVLTPRGTERGVRSVREFIVRQTYGVGLHIEQPRLFADGNTVVLAARAELRWVDNGDLADASDMAAVFHVHDERIGRMEIHDELRSALAAAGLSASHLVTDGHDCPSRPDHATGGHHA